MTSHESMGRVVLAANVRIQRMPDGDAVLLHMGNEVYFGLDPIGTRIWDGLVSGDGLDDTIAALLDEYEVDPERLRRDVAELLGRLRDSGLVEVTHE